MPPAVRLSDKAACPKDAHGCPACPHPTFGPAVNGSTNVFVNKLPAIRLGDPGIHMACCGPNQWKTAKGSGTVYVNGKPLCRMGDKTTHCGGDGKLINGSPNVFIDDGASGSMASKLLAALEQAIRDALYGKHDAKDKKAKGDWHSKKGGGKNKKGKGAKGKHKDKKHKDEDHSKDANDEEAKKTGGIVKTVLTKAVRPGEKVEFEIHTQKACKGTIKVEAHEKTADGDKVVTKTSVTAHGDGKTLKGSFKAPKLGKDGKDVHVHVKAQLPGKKASESNECVVTDAGLVIYLYDEPHGAGDQAPDGTTPTGQRPSVKMTAQYLEKIGVTGPVKATVKVGGKTHAVTFDDTGKALIPPGGITPPHAKPGAGHPYAESDVQVKITSPADLAGKFKVKAFVPKGG